MAYWPSGVSARSISATASSLRSASASAFFDSLRLGVERVVAAVGFGIERLQVPLGLLALAGQVGIERDTRVVFTQERVGQ